ncbi:hypothetical protein D3C71_1846250 [compost metagenome]
MQPLPDVGGLAAAACITLGLQHWQHHEQLWLESEGVERQQALAGIVQGVTLLSEAAATLAVAPSWLPPLLAQHASLAQEADGERLSALLHGADYVGLQLAIAAWLHLGH